MSLGDILGIIGLLVSVGGIALSCYLYVRTFTSKSMATYIHTTADIDEERLRTLSSGGRAPVRYADCMVWNSGRMTISGDDLKSEGGVEIVLSKEAEIVKGPFIQVSLRENKVEAHTQSSRVSCRFDYLDPGQGFQVTVGYIEPTPDMYDPTSYIPPKIRAVIVGIPKGLTPLTERVRMIREFYQTYGFVGALVLIFFLVQIFSTYPFGYALAIDGAIIVMVIIGAMAVYRAKESRRPRGLMPLGTDGTIDGMAG
jgi:hypothetical protein